MSTMEQDNRPYTTLALRKTTRDRMHTIKRKGMTWDRFLNDLLDLALQENETNEQQNTGDHN